MVSKNKPAPKNSTKAYPTSCAETELGKIDAMAAKSEKAKEAERLKRLTAWTQELVGRLSLPVRPMPHDSSETRGYIIYDSLPIILRRGFGCEVLDSDKLMCGSVATQLSTAFRSFAETLTRKAVALEAIEAAIVAATTEPDEDEDEDEGDQDE